MLRTDNGKEYVNNMFKKYMSQHGILHQKTSPYTPEQNGVAERMNRTISEKVRCMLFDAGLNKSFWAEAVDTAAYLLNRIPCRKNNKSPEEIWTKRKPNLKYLKVFGCKAMVHVPKEKRLKLDAKSIECIMLGYSQESKAYRLLDRATSKIIISRNVIFFENEKVCLNKEKNASSFPNVVINENKIDNSGREEDLELSIIEVDEDEDNIEEIEAENESDETNSDNEISDYDDANDITYTPEEDVTIEESELRRSTRNKQANFACDVEEMEITEDPDTPEQALSSVHADEWKLAMRKEYDSLLLNKTWELTDLPAGKKAISSKWVFKTKINADGEVICRKARLVAKGYSQKKGIDYEETFSPVVRYTSIRFLLALAANHRLMIHQMDAVTAFLNGKLEEEVYIVQPRKFEDGTRKVCRLLKSIYGLKQSSRIWNETLNNVLVDLGLTRSDVDQCIYFRIEENQIMIVAIYVDDVLLFTNDVQMLNKTKAKLKKSFKMKDIGEVSSVLGMHVTRNKVNGDIKIDQSQYIENILRRFRMVDCNPVKTPADPNQKLTLDMCAKDDVEKKYMANVPYMEAVGALLFLAQVTRPDICFAVNMLSRFSQNPGKVHWEAVKRVLRYVKGTINKGIVYKKNGDALAGYCDADWASNVDDRRSTTGYVFLCQNGAISWATKRQKTIALSSTEAEYMSIVAAIQESLWLKRLEAELSRRVSKMMILYSDNKSAIHVATNNAYSNRTKHVDIKCKFVKEKIKSGDVKLIYCPTNEIFADILTKSLVIVKHENLVKSLGVN